MIFMLCIFLYILLHIYNKLDIFKYFQPFLQQQEKWPLHLKGLPPCCGERVPWDAPVPSAWMHLNRRCTEPIKHKGSPFLAFSKCKALNFGSLELSKFGKLEDSTDNPKEGALTAAWTWEVRADLASDSERRCSAASLPTWRRCCSSSLLEVTLLPASLADCSMNDAYREYLLKSTVGGPRSQGPVPSPGENALCFCGACFYSLW